MTYSAFLGHFAEHLRLLWRSPSPVLLSTESLSAFRCLFKCLSFSQFSSVQSSSLSLSPLTTPMSLHLTDKYYERNEDSDLRVTERGITRLIICHLTLPLECDLHGSKELYFLIHCGIHLQQCLTHRNYAIITVVIFNFVLRDTLCSPTLQNSTVQGLLIFYHRVDSKPCGYIYCLQV